MGAEERLQERMGRVLERKRHELAIFIERMKGLSPLEKLNCGYSYVEDERGKHIGSVEQVRTGQTVRIQVRDGRICATVTGTEQSSLSEVE